MAIPQTRYVAINSGVAAAPATTRRELIARVLTTNAKAPSGGILEFANITEVGNHFGGTSAEYAWASRYFGFVSKSFKSPQKISFGRYADSNIAASVIGTKAPAALTDFKEVEDGAFDIAVNGDHVSVTGLDFSSATSLSDVASTIQTAIQYPVLALLGSATFTYSNGVFVFTASDPDVATVTVLPYSGSATATDISGMIRLTAADDAVTNAKVDAETPAEAIGRSAEISDNFATFAFLSTLTAAQMSEVAAWSEGQNNKYLYCVPCTETTATDIVAAVGGFKVWAEIVSASGNDEFMAAAIAAATNYSVNNSTQNYMFQQFGGAVPTVTTTQKADFYDNLHINYYGMTQRAGRQLAFLQRGVLMDGTDAGVYVNEIWLKDALQVDLLNLLVGSAKVPASIEGESMVCSAMQGTLNQALANGVIMPGKELTDAQKVAVDNITGVEGAWFAVQTDGYKLTVKIELDATTNEYKANYLLVYSKGDSIRKIEGTDVLI